MPTYRNLQSMRGGSARFRDASDFGSSGFDLDAIRDRFDEIRKKKYTAVNVLQDIKNVGASDVARITSVGLGPERLAKAGLFNVNTATKAFELEDSEHGRQRMRDLFKKRTAVEMHNLEGELPPPPIATPFTPFPENPLDPTADLKTILDPDEYAAIEKKVKGSKGAFSRRFEEDFGLGLPSFGFD